MKSTKSKRANQYELYLLIGLAISLASVYGLMESKWENTLSTTLIENNILTSSDIFEENQLLPPIPQSAIIPLHQQVHSHSLPIHSAIQDTSMLSEKAPDQKQAHQIVEDVVEQSATDTVKDFYTICEEPAEPVGGMGKLGRYILKNIHLSSLAQKQLQGCERVFISFMVNTDGSLSEFKVVVNKSPVLEQSLKYSKKGQLGSLQSTLVKW